MSDFGSRADRVARGIEHMCKVEGWDPAKKIDFTRFKMHLTCNCVVGQYQSQRHRMGWYNGLRMLRDNDVTTFIDLPVDEWAKAFGFDVLTKNEGEESYADLQDEWLAQLGRLPVGEEVGR